MPKRPGKVLSNESDSVNIEEMERLAQNLPDEEEDSSEKISLASLKDLIFLGKLTKKEKINGFVFEVSTLSIGEQKQIMQTIMKSGETDRLLEIKPLTVSYSLRTINGVPLEDLNENEDLSVEERRLAVVLNMQIALVERLHRVHESLIEGSNKEVGLEDIKK
jgi:hypothetical protein